MRPRVYTQAHLFDGYKTWFSGGIWTRFVLLLYYSFLLFSHFFLFFSPLLVLCPRAQPKNKYCDCMRVNGITDGFSAAKVKRSGARMRSGGTVRLTIGDARVYFHFRSRWVLIVIIYHALARVSTDHAYPYIPTIGFFSYTSMYNNNNIILYYYILFLFCRGLSVGGGAYIYIYILHPVPRYTPRSWSGMRLYSMVHEPPPWQTYAI